MMEEYLLPERLPEKFRREFLKDTLKTGDYRSFEGFIVSLPNAGVLREVLWKKLSPIIGDFEVRGITPFPEKGFPVLPIVIPYYASIKGRVAAIEGRIYDFSMFSNIQGRFLLVDRWEKRKVEDYILKRRTGLDGKKIYRIFDSAMAEVSRDVMLSYFLSSSRYIQRTGGCTVTLLDPKSKYYTGNFKELEMLIGNLHPILRRDRMKITLLYDDEINVSVAPSLHIKYGLMKESNALRFYPSRRAKEWEKSALTRSDIRREELIGSAEIPFIAYEEETMVDDYEIREYAIDLLSYVMEKHIETPEIGEEYVNNFKMKFIRRVEKDFPIISEAMKMGIIMDIANVNGFGEHLGRLVNSWERLGVMNPEEKVLRIYSNLFERIEDVMGNTIRKNLSALGEKKRIERILNRILWELNTLKPEGWNYFYFEKKAKERGVERIEKIFDNLLKEGIIIEKRKGLFYAVSSL